MELQLSPSFLANEPLDFDQYFALGMIAIIDIDCGPALSEMPINDYMNDILKFIKERNFVLSYDSDVGLEGYAIWENNKYHENTVNVVRLVAPRGGDLNVERLMKAALPTGTTIKAKPIYHLEDG
ncbi:MAG: hypothetical protein JJ894_16365 [Dinoroseobacter sp.]|nr:hypothetical protein [Dinoroseobacter sp.]